MRASMSSGAWYADTDTRSRDVPRGTVGGRIAGTYIPRSRASAAEAASAAVSLGMRTGTTGEASHLAGGMRTPNAERPATRRATLRESFARRASPSPDRLTSKAACAAATTGKGSAVE